MCLGLGAVTSSMSHGGVPPHWLQPPVTRDALSLLPSLSFSVYVLPPKRAAPLMHVGTGLGVWKRFGEV